MGFVKDRVRPASEAAPARAVLPRRTAAAFAGLARDLTKVRTHAAKRDGEAPPETAIATVVPVVAPESGTASPEGQLSGTIPDVVTPPGQGRNTGEEYKELPAEITPGGTPNVKVDLALRFRRGGEVGGGVVKHDPVASGVAMGGFTQPGGKAVPAFGEESYEPAFKNIAFTHAAGKYTISGTLDINCPWGTDSGGNIDVPSGTDAVVTKANYAAIVADLTPAAASPFKSPRNSYYSQKLVERHEKFHGTDDNAWSIGSGLPIVKAHLEAGSVSPGSAAADVAALVESARIKLVSENMKYYKGGGADHGSYAGEIRAYTDGKAEYTALANAVDAHGKTLP